MLHREIPLNLFLIIHLILRL